MGDDQVPDDRAQPFGVGRGPIGSERRDDDAGIRCLGGVAAVAADHAEDLRARLLRQLQCRDQVGGDAALAVAAAY